MRKSRAAPSILKRLERFERLEGFEPSAGNLLPHAAASGAAVRRPLLRRVHPDGVQFLIDIERQTQKIANPMTAAQMIDHSLLEEVLTAK